MISPWRLHRCGWCVEACPWIVAERVGLYVEADGMGNGPFGVFDCFELRFLAFVVLQETLVQFIRLGKQRQKDV
jgi:ferredoxin